MEYKYGKGLCGEIVAFPHALEVDPEGIAVLRVRLVLDGSHSDDYIKDMALTITTSDNKIYSYSDYVKRNLDPEFAAKVTQGIYTADNKELVKTGKDDQEKISHCYEIKAGYQEDKDVCICQFGVPIWGTVKEMKDIIAFDVRYSIGKKRIALHIPVEINLTENESISMISITYDPENNIGGCSFFEQGTVVSMSDYDIVLSNAEKQLIKNSQKKMFSKLGVQAKKDLKYDNRRLFTKSILKMNDVDEVLMMHVPETAEDSAYRLHIDGVAMEDFLLI